MDSYMLGAVISVIVISVFTIGGIVSGQPTQMERGIQSGGKPTKKRRKLRSYGKSYKRK
jgi:hypothetical protein